MLERHFKVSELADMWGFGVDKVRAWMEAEPGVLVEDRPERMHKRGYRSMRVPESIAARVYQRQLTT